MEETHPQQRPLWQWALAAAAALLVLAIGGGLVFRGKYPTTQTAQRTFIIEEDFTKVRKILVRTDSAKQIVTMGGDSEFISQKWSGGEVAAPMDLEKQLLNPDWKIALAGLLRVRTKDEYVGPEELDLKQDVRIEPDFLDSKVALKEPTGRVQEYSMHTRFSRNADKGNSRVELELTQRILTDAPWFAHGIADRRVRASAERALANQETAIRKVIADNIDDVPLFPLR